MKALKKVTALILIIIMLLSVLPLQAIAAEDGDDAQLCQQLQEAVDESAYPNGLFEMLTTRMNTSEDMSYVEIAVVRKGGTAGAASVAFKAIDVTAEYGKDYTLSVKNGLFYEALPENEDARPLIDSITNSDGKGDNGADADVYTVLPDPRISTATPGSESSAEDTFSETKATGLRAMRDASVGNTSTRPNWREVDNSQKNEALEQEKVLYEGLPGVCCTLNFADGEYIKKIRFNTIDDSISEDEEQVLFALIDPVGGVTGDSINGFMNIKDNEKKEPLLFEMADSEITANPDEGYAEATVKRTAGLYRYGSVYVGTAAVSAKPGVDYNPGVTELRFVPGQEMQKVRVPLLSGSKGAGMQFYVRLDPNGTGASNAETGKTLVTITAPDQLAVQNGAASGTVASYNALELSNISYDGDYKVKTLIWSDRSGGSGQHYNSTAYVPVFNLNSSNYISFDTDLTMVDKMNWYWSNPPASDQATWVAINGDSKLYLSGHIPDGSRTYTLTDRDKTTASIRFNTKTSGSSGSIAEMYLDHLSLYYTPVTVVLDSDTEDADAVVVPKTYTATGTYTESAPVFVGGLSFGGNTVATQKTFYDGDTVNFEPNYADTKLSDTSKVYLWGYKIERIGAQGYYYVQGNSLDIRKLYTGRMKDMSGNKIERSKFLMDNNTVVVRPVYKARTAFVKIDFDAQKGGMAQNSFANGEMLRLSMVDTVKFNAYAKAGSAVTGYASDNINCDGAAVTSDETERNILRWTDAAGSDALEAVFDDANLAALITPVFGVDTKPSIPNELDFTAEKTFTKLTVEYGEPAMTVAVHPLSGDQDKGAVLYVSGGTQLTGDKDHPMEIKPMERNKVYTISGLPATGYRMRWADFTGDKDRDGNLSIQEYDALGKYAGLFNRTALYGLFYNYVANYDNPLIYYSFEPKPTGGKPGTISDRIVMIGGDVLSNTSAAAVASSEVPVVGAEVLVGNQSGGDEPNSASTDSSGVFSITSKNFGVNERYSLIISYKGINYKGYADVNASSTIKLQEYDDFIPYNFTGYETVTSRDGNGKNIETTSKLDFKAIGNKDTTYTFQFNVKGAQPGLSANKAYIRIYSKQGAQRGNAIAVTPSNGSFAFTLNPASFTDGILPGDYMTLQIEDQYGTEHLEHNVGFSFIQSLDTFSLLTSFKTPATGAIDMVGSLDTAFNLGLSGKMSDYGTQQGEDWIVNFGFNKSWEKELGDEGKKEDETLKEAAKGSDAASTAKDAVDNGDENKTSASLTNSMKFDMSTAVYLKLSLDKDPNSANYNCFYFNEMIVSATLSGSLTSKVEIQTPVGVTVFVQLDLGGNITALMAIERYHHNVYLDENGSVDFTNASDTNPERDFTIYGKFSVNPYIAVTAGASLSVASLSVTGMAAFNMDFTTMGSGSGTVTLTSDLALKVLCFEFNWHIADKTWDLFNYGTMRSLRADSLFSGEDYLYDSIADAKVMSRDYLENRGTWQGGGGSSRPRALSVSRRTGNEQALLAGVYPYPYTCLADLGDDRQLLVFLDDDTLHDDRNRTQLYYSLNIGSTWSEPQKVDTEGTPDSLPCVYDVGDSVLVAWSSAYELVSGDDDVLQTLNKNNIKASFFSKDTLTFGDVQEVTKQTEDDVYSDTNPYIAYWQDESLGQKNLMIVYTKSQYASTDEKGTGGDENAVVGDVVNPSYTALAYRFYDFDNNCWFESGGEPNYYGQSFIDASKYVDVDESDLLVDAYDDPAGVGFWSRVPKSDQISIRNHPNNDPLIVDSDAIGYGGYAVFAYAVDTDSDSSTTLDRELFIQLYDFNNHVFFPSIRIPEAQATLSNLLFDQSNDNVYLYYLSDGDIHCLDIGYLVNNELMYYGDKGAFVVNKQKGVYRPSQVVVQHKYDLVQEEDGNEVRKNDMPIDEFMVDSNDGNVYIVWGENGITYKDGVDPNSAEAADPENYFREHQIYAVRQTIGNLTESQVPDGNGNAVTISYRPTEWSDQVQLTDEQGANYNDLDIAILSNGNLRVVYVKGMSQVIDVSGEAMPAENVNGRILMTTDFNVTGKNAEVTIESLTVPQSGETLPVTLMLSNRSLSSLDHLTVSLVQVKDGVTETVGGQDVVQLKGGAKTAFVMPWQAPEDLKNISLRAVVSGEDGVVLCSAETPVTAASSIDITDVSTEFVGRNQVKIKGTATNNGNIASDDAVVSAKANSTEIGFLDLGVIAVGESRAFTFYGDISKVTFDSATSGDGTVTDTATLNVRSDGDGEMVDLTRSASPDDMALINNISGFVLKDNAGAVLSDRITMSPRSSKQVLPDIGYKEENQRTPYVVYDSSDESVVGIGADKMTLNTGRTGTAIVTAYIFPPDSVMTLSKNGLAWTGNLSTLPDGAVLTKSFTVTVANGGQSTTTHTPAPPSPVNGGTSAETTASITGNAGGHVTATVSTAQVESAVTGAKEAAAKSGLFIDVNAPDGTEAIDTDIPVSALRFAAESGVSALTLHTSLCTVSFDENALSTICSETAGDSVRISVAGVDPLTLSETARAFIGDRPVFSFTVTSGDQTISELNGHATLSMPYTPRIGEDTDAIVIYRINAVGLPEIVSDCSYDPENGTVVFHTDHFSEYVIGYNKVSFSDVQQDVWYANALDYIAARGITTGTGNGSFSPDASLTRGQFIVMLLRAFGLSPAENLTDNFMDAGNTYYTKYLAAAKQLGIAGGIGNNLFAPDREITRQEMCTLLYHALELLDRLPEEASGKTTADFLDKADIASWASDAVTAFVKVGVLNGSDDKLLPTGILSRAQMAQIFYNLMKN